jgi:DNA-binding beta-propeller fold protein YncE
MPARSRIRVGRSLAAGVACLAVAFVYLQSATGEAEAAYGFLTKWGQRGTADGEFRDPLGVAVNTASGDVYVADEGNDRVQRFDSTGAFLGKWGTTGAGDGRFNFPVGVAVNSTSGDVYVADNSNFRIQRFDSTGAFLGKWGTHGAGDGQFGGPYGVAVNPVSGDVYVADTNNHRIERFNSTGAFLGKWGTHGAGDGQFRFPEWLAVDSASGDVYVADEDNFRIQRFSATGTFLGKWGTLGSATGQFSILGGVAADPVSGDVHVVDWESAKSGTDTYARLQRFTSTGTFLEKFGKEGNGPGEFEAPGGIALNPSSGDLYVADDGNNRIQRLTTTAPFPAATGTPKAGKTAFAKPVEGEVLVEAPGSDHFDALTGNSKIPIGSTVDTTNGTVKLVTGTGKGHKTQHADFWAGLFKLTQAKHKALVTLTLKGPPPTCKASAREKRHSHKQLYGNGHGHYRTKGHHSAGTVNGTKWLTEELCTGTLTKVFRGSVSVLDFTKHKTFIVKAGHQYLAKGPP